MIQATSFSVVGTQTKVEPTKRLVPYYTAFVENSDGTVLDSRTAFSEFDLYDWLESFALSPRPPREPIDWDGEDDRGGDLEATIVPQLALQRIRETAEAVMTRIEKQPDGSFLASRWSEQWNREDAAMLHKLTVLWSKYSAGMSDADFEAAYWKLVK